MVRRGFLHAAAFLAALMAMLIGVSAFAETARNPLAIDMVIVIENSTRMNQAGNSDRKLDREGLRFDAAAALISMCDAKYSRANFFLFNNDLFVYSETNTGNVIQVTPDDISLFDISLPQHKPQRQKLMEILNGEKIRNGYGTKSGADIGKAFSAAVDVQMRELGNGNRKVILLLTSGSNNLSDASIQMAREAKSKADGNGIEVYAVALTDTSSTQLLQELVTNPDNYQYANGPEDLVDVYRNFFASMIGSDPMESSSVKLDDEKSQISLNIPNNSVAEVNIILPLRRVDDLILTDPNGKIITRTEDNVLVSKSRNFISYKLISPESSTYQLSYTSADEKNIVIQYVFSYGVQVEASANAARINKHEPVTITAKYIVDDVPTTDEKLYNIPATLTLWKGSKLISVTEMVQDALEYHLTFTDLAKEGIGEYTASIHFEGDGLKRDSDPIVFELVNNAPELISPAVTGDDYNVTINIPKNPDSYVSEKNGQEWDLNSFVKDINGDELSARIVSNSADVIAVVDGMKLSVRPKANTATQGEIHVVAHDMDGGESPELSFPVNVVNYEERYDTYTARFDTLKDLAKDSVIGLTLRVYDELGNEVRGDDQLPSELSALVKDGAGHAVDVALVKDNNVWKGEFRTGGRETEYTAAATIHVGQKTINAEKLETSSKNKAPSLRAGTGDHQSWSTVINIPRDADSYIPAKKGTQWDLNSFVEDLDGDVLTAEIISAPAEVSASLEGMTLIVLPKKDTAADGEIHVVVKDVDGGKSPELVFQVKVENYESRYDIYTAKFDPVKNVEKNSTCELTLRLYNEAGNEVRTDDQVPDEIIAVVMEDGVQLPDVKMAREEGRWTGSFATGANATDYTVSAIIQVGQKTITAEETVISSANKAPILKQGARANHSWSVTINEPSDPETYKVFQQTWQLDDLVEDPNGDRIMFEVDKNETDANVSTSINSVDQTLTISTRLNTETDGDVVVVTKDNDGLEGPVLKFHVSVKSNEEKYKLYSAEIETDGRGKNKEITVTFTVDDENGMLVTGDTNLPDNFDATYTLGNVATPLSMTRGEDGKWTGTFKTVDTEEVYTISAGVKVSDNVSIVAPEYSLSTVNTAPSIKKELNASELIPSTINIQPFLIWNQETGDIVIPDLNEFFTDADGDKLVFTVEKDFSEEQAEVSVQGNTLTVRGLKETSDPISFTVTATDNEKLSVTSQSVSFSVKSLQKQGLIIIACVVAAIIILLILIQALKPKYPSGAFIVSVNGVPYDMGSQLPKGGMAKKAVNLQSYAPTMAKAQYGPEIHTALSHVIMKPGNNKTVKIDATKANSLGVKINGKNERKGTLSNNGKLTITHDDKTVVFELKVNNPTAASKKSSGGAASKPAVSTTEKTTTSAPRSSSGSRT